MSPGNNRSVADTLSQGALTLEGEFLWGSNYTYLCTVEHNREQITAVYKPTRGERPLWDFPRASLARREAAAYIVSEALGWEFVPPTVYRKNGPLGPGSLQLFIEHDPEHHYFNFTRQEKQRLRPVALFDHLINNADRKASHVLLDPQDHLWLIDHGICFHVEDKLRTVIWDFAGEPIPEDLCADVDAFVHKLESTGRRTADLKGKLKALLNDREIEALARRGRNLVAQGHFPEANPKRRHYPWPPV
jgi:hypothetical protein